MPVFLRVFLVFAVQQPTPPTPPAACIRVKNAQKKGGHPARPVCQASSACGGYDIGQTEAGYRLMVEHYSDLGIECTAENT
jgi:hypothetical protein